MSRYDKIVSYFEENKDQDRLAAAAMKVRSARVTPWDIYAGSRRICKLIFLY